MATVQLIISGRARMTIHDTFDYPLILQFGSKKSYDQAEWVIPSYARHIPTWRLSEIRVDNGTLSVLVDGPEGFCSGPYTVSWVRNYYPRGKHCAFLRLDPEARKMVGVTNTTADETLFVEDFSLGGGEEILTTPQVRRPRRVIASALVKEST